jgi:hypothetical protein
MNKKWLCLLFPLLIFFISSCNEEKDKVKEISKDGSIETIMNVEHLNDQLDVIKTTHKIWVKNMLVKTAVHTDTIPSLGIIKEEMTISNEVTKQVAAKKDYEFYITVK